MKIGIDARMLGSGSGIGRYIQQLVKSLQQLNTDNNFVLFLRKENWAQVKEVEGFKKVIANIPWYSVQEQVKMPCIINEEEVDLMHFPHWNIPILYQGDFIVTIHDLIMFHYPRPEATTKSKLTYWVKDKIHRLVVKSAAKKSKKIIAPSKFTRNDIKNTLSVSKDKIEVTYQAPFSSENNVGLEEIKQKYDLKQKFALYVGSAYPHKNLKRLTKAWKNFKKIYSNDYQLILVGKEDYFYKRLKDSELYKKTDSIKHLGFIQDNELNVLYKLASVFIFPSLYEGFGLPPLEAMHQGTPVLASDRACIPEVLQNSALYVDSESVTDLREGIHKIFEDNKLRKELRQESENILKQYSWQKLATQTYNIYEKVV